MTILLFLSTLMMMIMLIMIMIMMTMMIIMIMMIRMKNIMMIISTLPSSLPTSLLAASSSLRPVWRKKECNIMTIYFVHSHQNLHKCHPHHLPPHLLQPLAQLTLHVDDVLHPRGQVVYLPPVDLLQNIPATNHHR